MGIDYPSNDDLREIRDWPVRNGQDCTECLQFVQKIWWAADWGVSLDLNNVWSFSTGGWSGNEEIIGAMKENHVFWLIAWESSRRGGHYTFKIPKMVNNG